MADANRSGGGITGLAGSDAERRTARELAAKLESLGREVVVEPTRVRPAFAQAHLIHAVAGIVGSVLAVYVPLAGLALLLLTMASVFGELTASYPLARLATSARASQNVVSDEDSGKPGLIVLVAHYDAPRGGLLNERPWARRWGSLLFGCLAVITVCAMLRLLGIEATWLTIIQFIPTVILIALCPLLADIALSRARTDAANGAGVDAVLRLAGSHGRRLEHFDLMVVFTGASAHFALGMRAWLRVHRKDLDPEATAVIVIDDTGTGTPHYAMKEGAIFPTRLHPTLVGLCADEAAPFVAREVSDAYVARAAGLPAIRLSSREGDDGDDSRTTYDVAAQLIESIDAEIGPKLA